MYVHVCMLQMCMLILCFVLYYTAELKDIVGYHNVSKEKVREGGRCGLLCGKYMYMYTHVVWGFVHIYAVHTGYENAYMFMHFLSLA